MRISQIDTEINCSRELCYYRVEFTMVAGVPTFDKTKSDLDSTTGITVANALTNVGAGIVGLRIPKCNQITVCGKNLIPNTATTGTEYRFHEVTDQVPASGTVRVRFFNTTFAAAFPTDGSRYQLILGLS